MSYVEATGALQPGAPRAPAGRCDGGSCGGRSRSVGLARRRSRSCSRRSSPPGSRRTARTRPTSTRLLAGRRRGSTCSGRTSSGGTPSRAIICGARASIQAGVLATMLAMAIARADRTRRRLLPRRLGQRDRAGDGRAARLPVPDPRGRAGRDPRARRCSTRRSRSASLRSPALIRVARGEALALREEDYVARRGRQRRERRSSSSAATSFRT